MKHDDAPNEAPSPSSNVRSLVSLAILIHLIVVAVAASSNFFPSVLQDRLLQAFSPYAQPLNLKLSDVFSHKLYHYTHGEPLHDDHFLEIEFEAGPRAGEVIRLPDAQWHGSPQRTRYQALARMLGTYAVNENDDVLSRLLSGVVAHHLGGDQQARAMVRVRRHVPVPLSAESSEVGARDPNSPQYFQTLYTANVGLDSTGRAFLTKLEQASQVAPLREREQDSE